MVPGYEDDTKSCKWCGSWMDLDQEFCRTCAQNDNGETDFSEVDWPMLNNEDEEN